MKMRNGDGGFPGLNRIDRAPESEPDLLGGQRGLQHCFGIGDVVNLTHEPATAGVLVALSLFAVDVEGTRMLWIEGTRILLPDKLLHHGKHVDLPFIDEYFGVVDAGLSDNDVAEVYVIDAVSLT